MVSALDFFGVFFEKKGGAAPKKGSQKKSRGNKFHDSCKVSNDLLSDKHDTGK